MSLVFNPYPHIEKHEDFVNQRVMALNHVTRKAVSIKFKYYYKERPQTEFSFRRRGVIVDKFRDYKKEAEEILNKLVEQECHPNEA